MAADFLLTSLVATKCHSEPGSKLVTFAPFSVEHMQEIVFVQSITKGQIDA